jgi:hypothetical protein
MLGTPGSDCKSANVAVNHKVLLPTAAALPCHEEGAILPSLCLHVNINNYCHTL